MFDCCGVKVCLSIFEKKAKLSNDQKSLENRTNMDIILSFLAKPVDKHGIPWKFIFYPKELLSTNSGI